MTRQYAGDDALEHHFESGHSVWIGEARPATAHTATP
jgi:hypothetical protein